MYFLKKLIQISDSSFSLGFIHFVFKPSLRPRDFGAY